MTKPEQSKPLGDAPPHIWGPEVPHGDPDDAAVLRGGRAGGSVAAARRRRGDPCLRGSVDPRLAPALRSLELRDLVLDGVVERLALLQRSFDLVALRLLRRDDLFLALARLGELRLRSLTSFLKRRTSERICASWSVTRPADSMPSRISSRLAEPRMISTRSGLPLTYRSISRASRFPCASPRLERAILSRLLTFCSTLIWSSSTCSALNASMTWPRSASSRWISARTPEPLPASRRSGGTGSASAQPPARAAGRWEVSFSRSDTWPLAWDGVGAYCGPAPSQAGHGKGVLDERQTGYAVSTDGGFAVRTDGSAAGRSRW